MGRLTRRLLAAAAATVMLSGPALADPLVVTAGTADAHEGDATFLFAGAGFRFSGEAPGSLGDALGDCVAGRCAPGAIVGLADHFEPHVSASSMGPATFDGRTWERVALSGDLFLDAGSVIVPSVLPGSRVTRSAPFTFRGDLSGYDSPELSGRALFSTSLRGGGMVSVEFSNRAEIGLQAERVTYQFEPTDPVPEPATLFLLGSGLAGIAAAKHRRIR